MITGLELLLPSDPRIGLLRSSGVVEVDAFSEDIDDLFRLQLPFVAPGSPEYEPTKQRWLDQHWHGGDLSNSGVWAHFPWRNILVHLPDEATFFAMRTNRNRNLITEDEQRRFHASTVAIAGLSVGSSCASALVLTGGPKQLRIADFDRLSIANLNRLPASVCDVGQPKALLCARRLLELHPYLDIQVWDSGLTLDGVDRFLGDGVNKVDVFVEEIDDVYLKVQARVVARSRGIPVVMATDNGDNAIVDIERFDLEPSRPLFHGRVAEERLVALPPQPNPVQRVAAANGIVGSCVTTRTQESLQRIGSQLVTWPQLGTAATVSGAAVAFAVRQIILGNPMPSGRYHVDLDATLDLSLNSDVGRRARLNMTADFERTVELMFGSL